MHGDCHGTAQQPGQHIGLVEGPGDMACAVQRHGYNQVRRRLRARVDSIQHFERQQLSTSEVPAKFEAADQPVDGISIK